MRVITAPNEYLLADRASELERLRVQSRVWEPAGRSLVAELGEGSGKRVVDIGCGTMGWLRVLSEWVGPNGEVVGTDFQQSMLDAARAFVDEESLPNVRLLRDDLFNSAFEPASFDLVHARFELAPLGRVDEQLAAYRRLVRPGGVIVLEDPDTSSWRFNPQAPAGERLIELVRSAFIANGGDLDMGRRLPELLGDGVQVRAHVVALPSGHPYLPLPLQFASALDATMATLVDAEELRSLRERVEAELAEPGRWGTSFTLIQAWRRVP